MSDVRKPNSERAEPGIGAYLVVTEVGKPHSEWAEPGIGRKAETAFLTNVQSLGGPLKGPPNQQFWIEFRAILVPGPPLGGLEARNHVFLCVFGPWGPETMCFYVFAPQGPETMSFTSFWPT